MPFVYVCVHIYVCIIYRETGSTPVIEDSPKPGACKTPLDLMRRMNAPFMYVRNWTTDLQRALLEGAQVDQVRETNRSRISLY